MSYFQALEVVVTASQTQLEVGENLNYLNFQPLEVVSRYRDPQPQVVENCKKEINSG